jgi:nitrilase
VGGSLIVGPNSRILAGPLGPEEGILYAQCNLEVGIGMKLRHDFAGHCNRPDVFQLHVNRSAPQLYSVSGDETDAEAAPDSIVPPPGKSTAESESDFVARMESQRAQDDESDG